MAIQVDPMVSPRIITVPEADGATITVQSLVNQCREWEHDPENLSYENLLSASGKEDLGNNIKVGITAKLEDAKVKFAARGSATTCTISGGNLVAVDSYGDSMFPIEPSTNVTVQLAQSSSATISELTTMLADLAATRTDLAFVKQMGQGRWKIENNQMIYYEADGETPLRTFNLLQDGTPTEFNPDERMPV